MILGTVMLAAMVRRNYKHPTLTGLPPKAGGPPAASFVGSINSDIENRKIKKNTPGAQLYDLECDPLQTKNVYHDHPEVVEELAALLNSYRPAKPSRPKK